MEMAPDCIWNKGVTSRASRDEVEFPVVIVEERKVFGKKFAFTWGGCDSLLHRSARGGGGKQFVRPQASSGGLPPRAHLGALRSHTY
eukprot:scaffold279687_cov19-Tisochrysis_lutea.AAC.1